MAVVYYTVEVEVDDDSREAVSKIRRKAGDILEELYDDVNVAEVYIYDQES